MFFLNFFYTMKNSNNNDWSCDHGNNCQPGNLLEMISKQEQPSYDERPSYNKLPNYDELLENEYQERVGKFFINRNGNYPDPEYLIEIGGVPTMPKSNLVAISAKWKSGKTFFCDILAAVFLGSDHFASCRSLQDSGKVLFFDTEQAESDTFRLQKIIDSMTPEERHNDLGVACLQGAVIAADENRSDEVSRYELITSAIAHEHPDLVIIDGIADLIYNYNDVFESTNMVNKLSALANKHNCCIVVVMHQNKGMKDKNMKGHIGTMLCQKCSDVFNVEKHGTIFEVTHAYTRHRQSAGLCFKLDANAVPMDAIADRQLQVEIERQQEKSKLRDQLALCVEDADADIKKSELVKLIKEKLGHSQAQAYRLLEKAERLNVLATNDKKHYHLQQE